MEWEGKKTRVKFKILQDTTVPNLSYLLKSWTYIKARINLMISQLAPSSNAFYFKDNYSKKDLITNANMRHLDSKRTQGMKRTAY